LDEDQKTAALKILNVTRKKPKGLATGLLDHHLRQTEQLSPIRDDDAPEVKEKKLKSMELIRKFAPEMPGIIATKIQARTLASVGEDSKQRQPEKYIYQFHARQRIEDRMLEYLKHSKPLVEENP
jgi:hypothetical protein